MTHSSRPWLLALVTCACLFSPRTASAHDYAQMPLAELHHELDKRPMGFPIGVTVVGGLSLIAGGYLVLYGLSFQTACEINGQSCNNGSQIAVGGVMAGVGAVTTTAGTIWLVSWDQTRREISGEIARRKTAAGFGAAPLFLESGLGLRLTGAF